jgi:hypothetical protein
MNTSQRSKLIIIGRMIDPDIDERMTDDEILTTIQNAVWKIKVTVVRTNRLIEGIKNELNEMRSEYDNEKVSTHARERSGGA